MSRMFQIGIFTTAFLVAAIQAAQSQDPSEDAQRAARQYSAVRALQGRIEQAETYKVHRDKIVTMIRSDLQAHQKPALGQVQTELRKHFDAFFSNLVQQVAEQLDQDGKFDLSQWLKEYCGKLQQGQKVTIKEKTRQRREDYLSKDSGLASDYSEVRREVASEQVKQIQQALRDDSYFPDTDEIERVYSDPKTQSEVVANVKRALISNKRLLIEAEQQVDLIATELVSNGLDQLRAQMSQLNDDCKGHTLGGMGRELLDRVKKYITSLKPSPGKKIYPTFPAVEKDAKRLALSRLDERIADSINTAAEGVTQDKERLSKLYEEKSRTTIEKAPDQHHTLDDSKKALEPEILNAQLQSKRSAGDRLRVTAEANPSSYDQRPDIDALPEYVDQRLDAPDVRNAWNKLSEAIRQKFNQVIPAVRNDIAEKQANSRCGILASGDWQPTEELILSSDPRDVDRRKLIAFPVWGGQPPLKTEVLEETWELWAKKASQSLAIGREALNRQIWIARDLQRILVPQIKADAALGLAHWTDTYTQRVKTRWQQETSPAASRYKALFKATETEIKGIVAEALNHAAKDAQRALIARHRSHVEKRIEQERKSGQLPTFDPHHEYFCDLVKKDWQKSPLFGEHEDLFPEVEETIRGIVQKSVKAQVQILKGKQKQQEGVIQEGESELTKIPDPDAFEKGLRDRMQRASDGQQSPNDAMEKLVEQARVLHRQNQLVDETKPGIESDVGKEIAAGGDPTVETWEKSYGERVHALWKQEELAKKYPQLLPPILERIHGIVVDLLKTQQLTLRDLVLKKQRELVQKHHQTFADQIAADPKASRSSYEQKYKDQVKNDWENSEEIRHLRKRYPDLLRETEDQISGIVAKLVRAELPQQPQETEPPDPQATGAATHSTSGAAKGELAKGSETGAADGAATGADGGRGADSSDDSTSVCPNCGSRYSGPAKGGAEAASPGGGGGFGGAATGGAGSGSGGAQGAGKEGGDALIPQKLHWAVLPLLLMLLLALCCLAWSLYYLHQYRKAQQLLQNLGPDLATQMRMLQLLVDFVAAYGDDAEARLSEMIVRKTEALVGTGA